MVVDTLKVQMVHPLDALQTMVRRIYGPNGCVWAQEQTHYTLWRHVRAEAGEVLVSQTVKDLVAGSGIAFEDRGLTELKGVPGQWRLYSVASC